jgi:hypothetical protein
MSNSPFGLIEMVFSFSIPLVWALWELHKLRQERKKDAEKAAPENHGIE